MAKLPKHNQRLVEEGGKRKCAICLEPIEEDEDMGWMDGQPAHDECIHDEGRW